MDLMAHDYDSLLRALLDRLPQVAPDWRDRSEADPGMVLMELFAYAGDQLGYLQDRVALEGFLRTAMQHESVRKLLRLVDYAMDPGCAGEALLLVEAEGGEPLFLQAGFAVATAPAGADAVVYETADAAVLVPALNRIALAADAPSGADRRQVVCAANLDGLVKAGDRLLLQQFDTGDPRADATRAPAGEWIEVAAVAPGPATTLTLVEPLAADYRAAGDPAGGIAPARLYGNAVRATHGASQRLDLAGTGAGGQAIELELAPVTHVPGEDGVPRAELRVDVDGARWVEVEDFVDSEAPDRHYRIWRSNSGHFTLVFGDGQRGAAPADGARIVVRYRVGNGAGGHVAAGRLRVFDRALRFQHQDQKILGVRNPFPSAGARDPEPLERARLAGPYQLRRQHRAVVPADYEACLAEGVKLGARRYVPVQSKARSRATGSWNTVFVGVDMPDRRPLAAVPGLRAAFEARLAEYRMAGGDVRVEDARYCPLHLGLRIEVDGAHFARDVRAAVERALVGPLSGRTPFFGPGRFGFGQAVYLSDLYAAVGAIEGVRSVAVTRFKRLGNRYPDCEAAGAIPVGALEVARCDNDPADTANGVLFIRTHGGKEG
ncbi:hypothetical protein WQ53_08485 [Pseudoxanthomonas suwonensis]|uniref:Baseplate protein J-like domain-containing protein n=1 Tax=Pseudoxanthomonas suwonensis TaxID=314722 RepID=A0A0E3Z1M9_9GAMM|nr:hypothetical protein WQ53_08485 [Pseudoxanthomonas suwonensis]